MRNGGGVGGECRVTVVIATRNRSDSLCHTLEQLESLPERPRILVVDNGSTDGTVKAVRECFQTTDLMLLHENLGAGARTVGARKAETPFVAFADDDSWWDSGALGLAADVLERHLEVAVIAARILVEPGGREDPVCTLMGESPFFEGNLPGKPVLGFIACGAVVRRSAFLQAGGFHPRLHFGGEEQLLALDLARHGWNVLYLPAVIARHEPSLLRDASERSQRQARNALWSAWLRRAWPTAFGVTWEAIRAAPHEPHIRAALSEAFRGLPWILRERKYIGRELERQMQLLDRQRVERFLSDAPACRSG